MDGGTRVPMNGNNQPSFLKRGRKESLTNIESLPDDLFFNILLLLPAQDIYNLRLVSWKWYHMIRNHNFIYAHLQLTTSGLLIQDYYEPHHPIFLAVKQGQVVRSTFSYNFRDNVFASCNGLILEYEMKNEDALYIANPVTKQQLILPRFFPGMLCGAYYGMGYLMASMEYKVVVTYDFLEKGSIIQSCAILTVGVDKSWRHIRTHYLSDTGKAQRHYGTPLITEGFMHWYRNSTHVLTLNLETEIFTETSVPQVCGEAPEKYCLTGGKCLSLLIPCCEFSWKVWEMKPETGEWTKLPNIDMKAQLGVLKGFGYEHYRSLVPVSWLSYREVLVFDSLNPNRACITFNIRTHKMDSFKLASYGRLYIFQVHRNSLVGLGG